MVIYTYIESPYISYLHVLFDLVDYIFPCTVVMAIIYVFCYLYCLFSVAVEKKPAKSEVDEAIADLINWTQQTKVISKQFMKFLNTKMRSFVAQQLMYCSYVAV